MALYRQLDAEIETLDRMVANTADEWPLSRLLMTHPVVGPNTALATEVYPRDPTRFADGKVVGSYAGSSFRDQAAFQRPCRPVSKNQAKLGAAQLRLASIPLRG